jgi:hypothetical protein
MIVEELLSLPPYCTFEGINFEFELINNGGNEMRICYRISSVDDDSPHKADIDKHGAFHNKFMDPVDPPFQGFLILFEGIETDVDLIWAARQCWFELGKHGIYKSAAMGKI